MRARGHAASPMYRRAAQGRSLDVGAECDGSLSHGLFPRAINAELVARIRALCH
jgi:hypothetical protein